MEDYEYSWEMDADDADDKNKIELHNRILVKEGFRWDGASVPKILWGLGFKPDGKHRAAALVHDFIYINKGMLPAGSMYSSYTQIKDQIQYGSITRKDADRLFGRMMKEAGVLGCFHRNFKLWKDTWGIIGA